MKKILLFIFICFVLCGCSKKEYAEEKEFQNSNVASIDDVEIYFDKDLVTFTSKEETETVYLTVDFNGYNGDVDFEYDVTGYGDVNISAGESEVEPGKFKMPLHFSPIENCALIITYKIKGTNESTKITIAANFIE